jgi:hypothetical protein
MKSKTDPNTRQSRAILTTNEINGICRTIDTLNGIALVEGVHGYTQLAADLRKVLDSRMAIDNETTTAKDNSDGK